MPQGHRHGVPTNNRGGDHPVVEYTGFQAYQTGVSTVTLNSNYPTMKLIASYLRWKDIELTNGVYTWPGTLAASISDAHADGYKICLRISCGADSPISSVASDANTGWMAAFVPYVRTLRNETNPRSSYDGEVLVPIPWDATHLVYYTRFMQAVSAYLDGPCPADSSHARKEHIYMFVAGMPTEFGTEMSLGYGQIATAWLESTAGTPPKLATSWTAASPANGATFTLTGDVSSIPQVTAAKNVTGVASTDLLTAVGHGFVVNDKVMFDTLTGGTGLSTDTIYYVVSSGLTVDDFKVSATSGGAVVNFTTNVTAGTVRFAKYVLLKVGGAVGDSALSASYPAGTEVVLLSAFNRSTKTGTVATNGRGWSGTTAISHNTTTTGSVFFADDSTTSGTLNNPITWNGLTGIFDHPALNRYQWSTTPSKDGGSVTEANRRLWVGDAWIDSINAQLTAAPSVKCGLAGSSIFRDNFVQANRVIDTLFTTKNYADKLICHTTHLIVDAAGTPGARTYAQADPNGAAWMQAAASYEHLCGFQTGGLSVLANGQAFIDACEDAIASYPTRFIETNVNSRFSSTTYSTIAVGGWPGGTVTMEQYCLSHASNLQARIPAV